MQETVIIIPSTYDLYSYNLDTCEYCYFSFQDSLTPSLVAKYLYLHSKPNTIFISIDDNYFNKILEEEGATDVFSIKSIPNLKKYTKIDELFDLKIKDKKE